MLCYAVLCCAMLCYAVLCCAMLCYAVLCYAMQLQGVEADAGSGGPVLVAGPTLPKRKQ
eukprot:COSAG06_NODE_17256_length_952_cov_1.615475_1_plen_58_part_10